MPTLGETKSLSPNHQRTERLPYHFIYCYNLKSWSCILLKVNNPSTKWSLFFPGELSSTMLELLIIIIIRAWIMLLTLNNLKPILVQPNLSTSMTDTLLNIIFQIMNVFSSWDKEAKSTPFSHNARKVFFSAFNPRCWSIIVWPIGLNFHNDDVE